MQARDLSQNLFLGEVQNFEEMLLEWVANEKNKDRRDAGKSDAEIAGLISWIMLGHCAGLRNTQKLGDYFRVPSVRHYLIVNTSRRTVVHHERIADGSVQTRIVTGGTLDLQPPGLTLEVAELFPDGA